MRSRTPSPVKELVARAERRDEEGAGKAGLAQRLRRFSKMGRS
jgi:hypothetical protein